VNEYDEDLAYVHDAGVSDLAQAAANRVVAELRTRAVVEGLVVDVGCGSGVAARRLNLAGYDVLGLDPSPAMLALARRRAPRATFRRASFLDAELPDGCVAVMAVGEVLNYHVAPEPERDLEAFFARTHAALRPGGLLVLDVAGPGRVPEGGPSRHWSEGDDWAVLVEVSERPGGRELTRRMVTFRRTSGRWRRTETEHHQRLYAASTVATLLRQAGFRARILRGYGDAEPFAPGHRVLIAAR
jgi:SAM-dependent methyltransferase